jgi:heparosan-N-sulfate-glucuronate 5-epimerase
MSGAPLHEIRSSRFLPLAIERVINATFSRGPGYEPTPIGAAFDAQTVSGYYIDFSSKTVSKIAADTDRILPVALVQLALGWWERHVAGEPAALDAFMKVCGLIESRALPAGDELRWPVYVPIPKYGLKPPWCSALTQSQAASVFVRAHLVTEQERFADMAYRAVRPLLSERPSDLVSQTAFGPILEEVPGAPASHILNGWITGLWGLWDVHLGLGDARAGEAFHAGVECLRVHLHAYDAGWWSRYSLYPHALEDLAKPIYHRYHVDQLKVLHRLTGCDDLKEVAVRWASYDRSPKREMALAQKAAFAIAERGRRRRWQARFEAQRPG